MSSLWLILPVGADFCIETSNLHVRKGAWNFLRSNKAYLNCQTRLQAQGLWRERLNESGFFTNLPIQTISVDDSLGRVTACSVYAKRSAPHYNSAAMDGIAVRAADTFGAQETAPLQLMIQLKEAPFVAGSCYVVDTGDVMPIGTNAVIMIEDLHCVGTVAEITAAASPWQHVRIIGEDIVANELVIPEHQVISPVDIAALMAAGLEEIQVLERPKVAVIPTGDEIVATQQELKPGAILDVNSHMLAAAVREWGGNPSRHAIVRDNPAALKQAISEELAVNDIVLVNAGTSAGTEDFTCEILSQLGEVLVHGVAIKPGKPVVLAICDKKPVVGLPGYPVSAMLTAELFVKDIVRARQKLPQAETTQVDATIVRQMASTVGVEEYVRVSVGNVQGKIVAAPLNRGAGLISSLTRAQGIISVNEASSGLNAGSVTPVRLLRDAKPDHNILSVGSHDLALELLGIHLKRRRGNISLSCANVGSMGGIMAIRNNEAHLAGIHMLDEATGQYNVSQVEKFLPQVAWRLVHLAMRQQGLMVAAGNPRNIAGLQCLSRSDVTFINRQRGSGTRMLLDYELNKLGIAGTQINGYEKEVGTHMTVAASVASGSIDAGLGVQAAAKALGLDFIPVASEQYDLLMNFAPHDERMAFIIQILQSPEFRSEVEALGGYDLIHAGKLVAVGNGGAVRM